MKIMVTKLKGNCSIYDKHIAAVDDLPVLPEVGFRMVLLNTKVPTDSLLTSSVQAIEHLNSEEFVVKTKNSEYKIKLMDSL